MYFQIEENTRVLEKLGQRYASPSVDRRSYASGAEESGDERATPTGSLGRYEKVLANRLAIFETYKNAMHLLRHSLRSG